MVEFSQFKALSRYERMVDFKKLRFIYNAVIQYLKESSKKPDTLRMLEVGCGDGSITLPLSSFGGTIQAFDLDDGSLECVKRDSCEKKIENISISKNDAYSFEGHGTKFDIIVISEVLEYLDQPEKIVAKLKNYLVPGGYLIVTIPNGYGPWELKNKIVKIATFNNVKDKECGHKHVQFFTLNVFKKLFFRNDYTLIKFGKSDSFSGLSYTVAKNRVIANIDVFLADLFPSWLVSGWYFVFKKA